jgi:hypothetical protein
LELDVEICCLAQFVFSLGPGDYMAMLWLYYAHSTFLYVILLCFIFAFFSLIFSLLFFMTSLLSSHWFYASFYCEMLTVVFDNLLWVHW